MIPHEDRMSDPEKITIIEGPPPTFEAVHESWLLGLIEGPAPAGVALCRLRTFNGPALVERCSRAWRQGTAVRLEYRTEDGLTADAPIVAARFLETDEGHLLLLWIRVEDHEIEVEIEFDDEADDEADASDLDLNL